jgi:putative Holliday junction resolvase
MRSCHFQLPTLPISRLDETDAANPIPGPILSLDLGTKRVGVAVSDPSLIAITALKPLRRSNWKQLLRDVSDLIQRFDAKTLVIGFPLRLDGSEGSAATETRQITQKFARSLDLTIYLQDERLTSREAEERLRASGCRPEDLAARVDSESAAIILRDFINNRQQTERVLRPSD